MKKLYDFYCDGCMNNFEKLTDKPQEKQECPRCGSLDTIKLLNRTSFKLDGVGVHDRRMKV